MDKFSRAKRRVRCEGHIKYVGIQHTLTTLTKEFHQNWRGPNEFLKSMVNANKVALLNAFQNHALKDTYKVKDNGSKFTSKANLK